MLKRAKTWFREILIELEITKISKEEKIKRIDEKYKDDSGMRYCKIMDLYRKELDELECRDSEACYLRFVEICAEHELDFPIACSGPS